MIKKQYENAIKIFNHVLKLYPYNEKAFVGKCISLRLLGQFEEATNLLMKAREKYPDNVRILNQIGWLCFDQKRYDSAFEIFDQILTIDPQNKNAQRGRRLSNENKLKQKYEKILEDIKQYKRERQYEKELESVDRILNEYILISRRQNYKFMILRKIELLILLRRFDEAHKIIDDALRIFPENVRILNQLGLLYTDRKKYDAAIKIFDIIIDRRGLPEGFAGKIECFREMGKFEEAYIIVNHALEKYPKNIRLLNELGRLYFDQKEYEKAIVIFDKIIELNQKKPNYFGFLGKISSLREMGKFEDADKLVKNALNIFPDNVRIINQRGRLYFSQKKYNKAVEVFDKVLSLEPYSENAFLGKIASLREMKMFKEAQGEVNNANKIFRQRSVVILNQQGWLYYDQKLYEEAIKRFNESLNIGPYNEYAFIGMIASLRLSRQFNEAERVVLDALDKYPQNLEILNQLVQLG